MKATIAALLLLTTGCEFNQEMVRTYEFRPGVDHAMPKVQTITITVVYVQRDEIHEIARAAFARDGLPFTPAYRFYGFFDYRTRTLYCEKWDSVLCGHELFHATDGDWHK